MDLFGKQGMKGPTRPAPPAPGFSVNRYSPVTNWNDDPFGADVFEPNPQFAQKKKPPPRPPPPKVSKNPEVPSKPTHFIRRPTVLTSLLSRKSKSTVTTNNTSVSSNKYAVTDSSSEIEAHKMFSRCEPKNINTGALIDLSSPPSSPTFTTRSSSDGLSVDSFGSDATTSTNHHNTHNGGNASQAESGFEDDFELFMHSRKPISKEDTFDDFSVVDPFSPPQQSSKPPLLKKPVISIDLYDMPRSVSSQSVSMKGPTIIRAKPARPKPPDNAAILKSTFMNNTKLVTMNVNTTTPIQKISNGFGGFGDNFESKPLRWDDEESPERESSPPMPSIPPPPPPSTDDLEPVTWPDDVPEEIASVLEEDGYSEPYAIALFDYHTEHPDDLSFMVNARIKLIRRVDDEWLFGSLASGAQGLFPSNYVEIKVPLSDEKVESSTLGTATALYDFEPDQPGDLRFRTGDLIQVLYKLNDQWYYGECNHSKGQFPVNYVQMS